MDQISLSVDISLSDYSWLISFIASGLVSNSIAEILGRKKSLMIDCLAFLTGFALYSVGQNAATLCVARAFLGYPLISLVSKHKLKNDMESHIAFTSYFRCTFWSSQMSACMDWQQLPLHSCMPLVALLWHYWGHCTPSGGGT